MEKQCYDCLWADLCDDTIEPCPHYTPTDDEYLDLYDYASDLVERKAYYQELLDEMEGDA